MIDATAEAIRTGSQAKAELELCGRAFANLRAELMSELIGTDYEHQAKRERLYVALKTLTTIEDVLSQAVENGANAMAYRNALAESGLTRP
jgi:hypothetical protein